MELIGLIVGQILLFGAASVAGLILCLAVSRVVSKTVGKRSALLLTVFLFPLLTVAYLDISFLVQGVVIHLSGEESFFSGISRYPLTGGYELVDWDEDPSQDYIGKLGRYETMPVQHVKEVQVSGPWILAEIDRDPNSDSKTPTDGYVILDSRSGEIKPYESRPDLQRALDEKGVQLHLISVNAASTINGKGHFWIGRIVLFLIVLPIFLTGGWLARRVILLRREAQLEA